MLTRFGRAVAVALALGFSACGDGGNGEPRNNAPTSSTSLPSRDPNQRYRVSTTVLESPSHGPQLCLGAINDSYPPQCGGPALAAFDWNAIENKKAANGTTWAEVTLVGTFDGETFILTERPRPPSPRTTANPDFSPACDEPDGDRQADTNTFRDPQDPDVVAVWYSSNHKTFNVAVRPGAGDRVRREIRDSYAGLLCVVERDQPTRASLRELQDRVSNEAQTPSPLGGVFGVGTDARRGFVTVECALADDVSKAWARERWGELVELHGYLEPVS